MASPRCASHLYPLPQRGQWQICCRLRTWLQKNGALRGLAHHNLSQLTFILYEKITEKKAGARQENQDTKRALCCAE